MKQLVALFLLVGGFSVFACGSSDSGNAGASCAPASFQADATPACTSCIESKCSTQYQALCSADCMTISNGSLTAGCTSALQGIGECADSKCPVCVPADTGAAGSGSGDNGAAGAPAASGGRACTIGTGEGMICNWYDSTGDLSEKQLDDVCTGQTGVPAAHCASDGLVGCCLQSGGGLCYYRGDAQSYMDACAQTNGTFTSTAP